MAGTAIVGYAELLKDIEELKPDLVIFDYGVVDPFIISDNLMPQVLHFNNDLKGALEIPCEILNFLIGHSALVYEFWTYMNNQSFGTNLHNFNASVEKFLALADSHGVPTILVRQIFATVPEKVLTAKLNQFKGVHYVDVREQFSAHYSEYSNWPHPETFWMNEIPPNEASYLEKTTMGAFGNLRLNLLQINENGQKVIAESLQKVVAEQLK